MRLILLKNIVVIVDFIHFANSMMQSNDHWVRWMVNDDARWCLVKCYINYMQNMFGLVGTGDLVVPACVPDRVLCSARKKSITARNMLCCATAPTVRTLPAILCCLNIRTLQSHYRAHRALNTMHKAQ